jgi:aminoglycoside 2'-N-acetyltransferase I
MHVELTPTLQLTTEDHNELRELRHRVHGPPETRRDAAMQLVWAGMDDTVCVVRVRLEGVLASSVFVTARIILVDQQPRHAGGIRGMLTHPDYRRQGLGRAAMQRATRFMWQDLGAEVGVLLSSKMAVPFYRGLGWEVFTGPVMCEQPSGVINYSELMPATPAMILASPGMPRSIKIINLCGLPW